MKMIGFAVLEKGKTMMRIKEIAEKITDALKVSSKEAKRTADAILTDEVRLKLDEFTKMMAIRKDGERKYND